MNSINFSACPAVTSKTPNFLTFSIKSSNIVSSSNVGTKNLKLLVTNCSTKSHTHIDNTTNDSTVKNQAKPASKTPSNSCRGLVFGLGESGSWDENEVGSPVVKRFLSDNEERWYMWYHGRSATSSDSIGLAVSSNGVHWQRGIEDANSTSGAGIVMACGVDWWAFDTLSIKPAEVMIMSSNKVKLSSAVYWLYYTGFSSEVVEINGVRHFPKSLPGLAMSQDGRNWARIEGDHHSGGLIDVGSNDEWDSLFIESPHVVFHSKGDLRMYYHSFDSKDGKFAIGVARSRDGIRWLKLGRVLGGENCEGCFDEMGVMNACVVREKKDGNYLMAYEGVAKDGKRGIGLAVSSDGLKDWRRKGDEAVLTVSTDNGWDSEGVGSPCLVQMDGEDGYQWRLYYQGVGVGGRTGIGLAVSQEIHVKCFRRWTGFHL